MVTTWLWLYVLPKKSLHAFNVSPARRYTQQMSHLCLFIQCVVQSFTLARFVRLKWRSATGAMWTEDKVRKHIQLTWSTYTFALSLSLAVSNSGIPFSVICERTYRNFSSKHYCARGTYCHSGQASKWLNFAREHLAYALDDDDDDDDDAHQLIHCLARPRIHLTETWIEDVHVGFRSFGTWQRTLLAFIQFCAVFVTIPTINQHKYVATLHRCNRSTERDRTKRNPWKMTNWKSANCKMCTISLHVLSANRSNQLTMCRMLPCVNVCVCVCSISKWQSTHELITRTPSLSLYYLNTL